MAAPTYRTGDASSHSGSISERREWRKQIALDPKDTIEKNQKGKEKETARRQRMVETKEVESTPSHGYRTRTEM
jgi:hypothetical protein